MDDFYESREWRELRYKVLKEHGGKCECCGKTARDGVVIHVDHIKPRSKFPSLELVFENLQVLCEDCNLGKSNKDRHDWRENKMKLPNGKGSFVMLPRELLRSDAFSKVDYTGWVVFLLMKDSMFDFNGFNPNVNEHYVRFSPKNVKRIGMGRGTYYRAIKQLLANGIIKEITPGNHGRMAVYDIAAWKSIV
jgi:hypothetical protein